MLTLIEIILVVNVHQAQKRGRHRKLEKIHNEALYILYSMPYIIRVRMKLLARMTGIVFYSYNA
jgi:hypothetical protein